MSGLIGLMGLLMVAALGLGTLLERRIRLGRFGRVPRRELHRWEDEGGQNPLRHRRTGIQPEAQTSH